MSGNSNQALRSTMQASPLLTSQILRHGESVFATSSVHEYVPGGRRTVTFSQLAETAAKLATALQVHLGVTSGDRVASLMWNTTEHFAAYLAVPSMGAVLHTVNPRLSADQLDYIVNDGGARVLIASPSLLDRLAPISRRFPLIEHVVLTGAGDAGQDVAVHQFDDLVATCQSASSWPDLDENTAAAICYTSGTTGNPRGVVYSHRSIYLHSMSAGTGNVFGLSEADVVLPIVPMFHVNAWGLPFAGWMAGTDFVLPGAYVQPEHIARMLSEFGPTVASAVPTVWSDLLTHLDSSPTDLSSVRLIPCGGAPVPVALMRRYQEEHDVSLVQAWGMTETSPVASFAIAPKHARGEDRWHWRSMSGRVVMGVELRVVDEAGIPQPWDGRSPGEVQVKGPWVTGAYAHDADPERFVDGWLRTGDIAVVHQGGYVKITDREKDLIKSGGEWISSVHLEELLTQHPGVREAAVIAVPDARWDERPLACIVPAVDSAVDPQELAKFLSSHTERWQVPERWVVLAAIPRTSVGKYDKKALREQHSNGELTVMTLRRPAADPARQDGHDAPQG